MHEHVPRAACHGACPAGRKGFGASESPLNDPQKTTGDPARWLLVMDSALFLALLEDGLTRNSKEAAFALQPDWLLARSSLRAAADDVLWLWYFIAQNQ